jgi:regulator of replication initiation timing
MQARRIKQLEAELDSLQSLGGATDAKRTANERRLLDEQLALQQRVADLESDLRAVKQDERSARADATTTAMEVEELRNKLRSLQQPQRANSSVQAGTAGAALDSSHHQHDMESRAAAARTGQPLHHTHHRSTGLRSPGDDSGVEAAPRPTSSRARSSSPSAHQSRRGRSRSGGRSDASGGGITGNFAFRPEELNRVMDMVAKEKSARDRSRSATPQP